MRVRGYTNVFFLGLGVVGFRLDPFTQRQEFEYGFWHELLSKSIHKAHRSGTTLPPRVFKRSLGNTWRWMPAGTHKTPEELEEEAKRQEDIRLARLKLDEERDAQGGTRGMTAQPLSDKAFVWFCVAGTGKSSMPTATCPDANGKSILCCALPNEALLQERPRSK